MPRANDAPQPEPDDMGRVPMSESLRALALLGERRHLRKGVQIITEGDLGDALYIVLSGCLRAFGAGPDGREITYAEYGPGEYVGEMSLDGSPRSANVAAARASVCVLVTRLTLQRHLDEDPAFAFELLAKVIRRARAATVGLKQIALNDVYGRLKALLERLAQTQADGSLRIDPLPSHREISQQLGCSREMVSRVMKDLERGGYVELGARGLRLCRGLPDKW